VLPLIFLKKCRGKKGKIADPEKKKATTLGEVPRKKRRLAMKRQEAAIPHLTLRGLPVPRKERKKKKRSSFQRRPTEKSRIFCCLQKGASSQAWWEKKKECKGKPALGIGHCLPRPPGGRKSTTSRKMGGGGGGERTQRPPREIKPRRAAHVRVSS